MLRERALHLTATLTEHGHHNMLFLGEDSEMDIEEDTSTVEQKGLISIQNHFFVLILNSLHQHGLSYQPTLRTCFVRNAMSSSGHINSNQHFISSEHDIECIKTMDYGSI